MRKLFALFLLLALVGFTLPGCGGGGGGDTAPSQALQDLVVAGTPETPVIVDPDASEATPVPVSAIQLSTSASTIGTSQTATLTLTLFDSSGQLVSTSKQVTFTLSAPALGSIASPVAVTNGFASRTFTARTLEGNVVITATVDGISATKSIQISNQASASTVALAANPTGVTVGGTTVVSATVRDSAGNLMSNGTSVNFTVDNSALGTIVSSSTTTNGIAQATFSAGTSQTGTANVTATSGSATGGIAIAVAGTSAGSIEFLSASPQIISITGAGGQETSLIKFLVKDSNGNAIIGSQDVNITLAGPNGGEYLGATAGVKTINVGTINGEASIILHSGNIPGTATLTATVVGSIPPLVTSSGVIAIGGGVPSAGHFSLSALPLNLEGLRIDNQTSIILALLADRYGNKNVLKGTTVSYYSECGGIDRAVALDEIGQGSVLLRTQTPRPIDTQADPLNTPFGSGSCGPVCDQENTFISLYNLRFGENIAANPVGNNPRDGICTITAVVDGEEKFIDGNGNGTYDLGETFVDSYDDIHIEKDDELDTVNPVTLGKPFDPTYEDLVVDRNKNGSFDGYNSQWDNNKRLSKRLNVLFTGQQRLVVSTSAIFVPNADSQTIYFTIHDDNFNRPIGGTSVAVTASGATLSGTKSYVFTDSSALGTEIFEIRLTDPDPANTESAPVEVTITATWAGGEASLTLGGNRL